MIVSEFWSRLMRFTNVKYYPIIAELNLTFKLDSGVIAYMIRTIFEDAGENDYIRWRIFLSRHAVIGGAYV